MKIALDTCSVNLLRSSLALQYLPPPHLHIYPLVLTFFASTLYEFLISSVLLASPLMTEPQERKMLIFISCMAFDAEKFSV